MITAIKSTVKTEPFPWPRIRSHEIEVQCAINRGQMCQPVQDGVQTVKSHGIQNDTLGISWGTGLVCVSLRQTQYIIMIVNQTLSILVSEYTPTYIYAER